MRPSDVDRESLLNQQLLQSTSMQEPKKKRMAVETSYLKQSEMYSKIDDHLQLSAAHSLSTIDPVAAAPKQSASAKSRKVHLKITVVSKGNTAVRMLHVCVLTHFLIK